MLFKATSKKMFEKYDTDNSGTISTDELKSMAYDLGYYLTDIEFDLAIKILDKTGSGTINYNEFKEWWNKSNRWEKIKLTDENMEVLSRLSSIFQKYDKNKSGTIETNEFKNFYIEISKKKTTSSVELSTMFDVLDKNKDGQISFNEFIDYINEKYDGNLSLLLD